VIAFSPVVETGWEPVLKEIKAGRDPGRPVRPRGGRQRPESLFVTFIGSDFVEEGRRAATWLLKKTGGKAVIAELQGTPGLGPGDRPQEGLRGSAGRTRK
jgi:ABC-type sugar transport system substrate-binding protein